MTGGREAAVEASTARNDPDGDNTVQIAALQGALFIVPYYAALSKPLKHISKEDDPLLATALLIFHEDYPLQKAAEKVFKGS